MEEAAFRIRIFIKEKLITQHNRTSRKSLCEPLVIVSETLGNLSEFEIDSKVTGNLLLIE